MKKSFEYKQVAKPLVKWINNKNIPKCKDAEAIQERSTPGVDLVFYKYYKRTRRKVLIEVKTGGRKFYQHFQDAIGQIIFHMENTKYYHEYGIAFPIEDKEKFIRKINKIKPGWRALHKSHCKWVFFANKNKCEKYSWLELLKKQNSK